MLYATIMFALMRCTPCVTWIIFGMENLGATLVFHAENEPGRTRSTRHWGIQ